MALSRLIRPASRHFLPRAARPTARRAFASAADAPKMMTVRDALNEALAEEMAANDKVFLLGEEVAQYNGACVCRSIR
jgi:pyruvate dehydrogenase E1 component beta subunit